LVRTAGHDFVGYYDVAVLAVNGRNWGDNDRQRLIVVVEAVVEGFEAELVTIDNAATARHPASV
jgi:hypothetical protein